MKLFAPLAVALSTLLPITALAAPVLYECDMTSKSRKSNWIADKMVFVVQEDGAVQVIDRHLLHFNDGPTTAKVRKKGSVLTMNWLLTGLKSVSKQRMPPAKYKAQLNTDTRLVTVYASSSAYSDARVRSKGGCVVRKDAKLPKILR